MGFAIYRYVMLAQGQIHYRPGWTLVFFIVWIAFVTVRKVALAGPTPRPYWRKFWRPFDDAQGRPFDQAQGRPANATARLARDFALIGLLPRSSRGSAWRGIFSF